MNTVKVYKEKKCQLCSKKAEYDSKTKMGCWAYLCQRCYDGIGISPTTKIVVVELPRETPVKHVPVQYMNMDDELIATHEWQLQQYLEGEE